MNQHIEQAIDNFRRSAARYSKTERYYRGDHDLAFATEKFENAFGTLFREFAMNLCPAICDAVKDKLRISGFGVNTAHGVRSPTVKEGAVDQMGAFANARATETSLSSQIDRIWFRNTAAEPLDRKSFGLKPDSSPTFNLHLKVEAIEKKTPDTPSEINEAIEKTMNTNNTQQNPPDEQPMLPFDPPIENVPQTPDVAALIAENEALRQGARLRDARDQISALLRSAGARSPELLFETAKSGLQFGEDGQVQDPESIVDDLKRKFPEQFGGFAPQPTIDAAAGTSKVSTLTKETLARMKPADIARLNWDDVRQVLSN